MTPDFVLVLLFLVVVPALLVTGGMAIYRIIKDARASRRRKKQSTGRGEKAYFPPYAPPSTVLHMPVPQRPLAHFVKVRNIVDIWEEWAVPSPSRTLDVDASILALSIAQTADYREHRRDLGILKIFIGGRIQFSAPIAMLMDRPTKLRAPILVAYKDDIEVKLSPSLDAADGTTYQLCVRMVQSHPVR